jgi:outer membrane protein OmpA-like peptidoglycan-associated protein
MRMRRVQMRGSGLFVATLLAVVTPPVAAQAAGTFEVGVFAQATYFDRSLRLQQAEGGGGLHLGIFPVRNWELEAEGSFTPTPGPGDLQVYYYPLRARLLFNLPAGTHTALLIGAGYVHNEYRHDVDFHDDGATAIAGFRFGLNAQPSIRVTSYLDYIPSPANGFGDNLNWGIQVGLTFLTGRRSSAGGQAPEQERMAPSDSVAAARADSLRRAAVQDSIRAAEVAKKAAAEAAARVQDSARVAQEKLSAQKQALQDSLIAAAKADSVRTEALRDSLRTTRNRARIAALQDSLSRVALRDSLRAMMAQKQTRVTLRGVNFEVNQAVLLPESRDILQDVAGSLVANPEVKVEVAGHTDNTGPRALNQRLSTERAEAVKAFLVEHGVEADRMVVRGYAWDQPVASNKTASGRAQNRRVELRRTD